MLTLLKLLLSLVLLSSACCPSSAIEFNSYARVSRNGDSINMQSDTRNKSISTKVSDVESTLIDKQQNETTLVVAKGREAKQMNDKSLDDKSTGRAIQSNYYFPLPQLSKPVQSNRYNNEKSGRLIVYPSYSANNFNNIDPTRVQYNQRRPQTGQRTAQRRFQYSPDVIVQKYKNSPGYKYSKPATDSAPPMMKFKAPIVVPDSQMPPQQSYLPPDMMSNSPPQSSYLPPNDMPSAPASAPGSLHFLPTILPQTTSSNPVIDLLAFPSHVNASYLPTELDAIKHSIEGNHQSDDSSNADETTNTPLNEVISPVYLPPKDLNNFPPNIESSYLPPPVGYAKHLSNSYLPQPSGENLESVEESTAEVDSSPYVAPTDLYNFPPNLASMYLPPGMKSNVDSPVNSYLPPASGDSLGTSLEAPQEAPQEEEPMPYVPPTNLYSFPPNVAAAYLPPQMKANINSPVSSYLPPASGDNLGTSLEAPQEEEEQPMPYVPPKNLYSFPPNVAAAYLPPQMKANSNPLISSYLPPASGENGDAAPQQNLYNFPPNVNSNYLPPQMKVPEVPSNSYLPNASGGETDVPVPSYMYNPPSNPLQTPQSSYLPPEMMKQVMASGYSYPQPSGSVSGFDDGSKQNFPGPMDSMPPSAPPSAPSDDHDHDHHHHHDHDHSAPDYPQWNGFSHDILYDDHHHHHHVEPETTTPEAPEEPRVKKYSYYYLGRKLWYVPLYFTLWFCLYVAALIIRSIGRHKVDLPNHYVGRSLHDMSHKETVEKINKMTEFAMQQIEDFKEKYL